ncbi:MAG TPA: NAD(P)H-dependent oxidoreductase subunit E [Candidatus Acidoferrum sp.]|nr:NAD(P)H-dependent oxidoreductase subunit E [Candidatus Acidoferrum sp.]
MNEVHDAIAPFPRERTWLLPALHAVQEALGWLPGDALAEVSAHLRVPASEVYGVASGYPEFRLAPHGGHLVRVCTGVSCRLTGGDALADALARRFPSSADVTVEPADCFFECSMAPLLEVDGAYRGRVTVADVDTLLAGPPRPHAPSAAPASRERHRFDPAVSSVTALAGLVRQAALRRRMRPALQLLVGSGACGRAVGADAVADALRSAVAARGLDAEVIDGACNGMCYAAPLLIVRCEGSPTAMFERVSVDSARGLVDCLAAESADFGCAGVVCDGQPWRGLAPAGEHQFWHRQTRVLLARCGLVDPGDLDDALCHGAYRSLARALDGPPADVIAAVKDAALQGRGGAFFPTAVKWEGCARAVGEPKYVVMNGEEGEPGIFKDRHLMEGDPHQVLEGVLLAAYAAGATRAILYVHGEANLSAQRLARAVAQAEAAGLCGERVLGRDFSCAVELRRGAGGFVLGEETALLESIEGRRAQPRTRPPFPVESGLWGKPTVINNVETLSAIPTIVGRGGDWFARLGTEKAAGTKIFGLSGPIQRPGVVEVRNGVTLRTLLEEIGGGLTSGAAFRGAVVGGPSGTIVPASLFDVPMTPRERVSPGTGGIVGVPEGAPVIEIVKTLLRFNANESCGKCTPCREGTPRLLAMIDELGAAPTVARARELSEVIRLASLCGLGQAAPLALLAALDEFAADFGPRPGS